MCDTDSIKIFSTTIHFYFIKFEKMSNQPLLANPRNLILIFFWNFRIWRCILGNSSIFGNWLGSVFQKSAWFISQIHDSMLFHVHFQPAFKSSTGGSKLYLIKLSESDFIMWCHMQQTQIIPHIRAISYGLTFSSKSISDDKPQFYYIFNLLETQVIPHFRVTIFLFSLRILIVVRKCSIIWVSSKLKI